MVLVTIVSSFDCFLWQKYMLTIKHSRYAMESKDCA